MSREIGKPHKKNYFLLRPEFLSVKVFSKGSLKELRV